MGLRGSRIRKTGKLSVARCGRGAAGVGGRVIRRAGAGARDHLSAAGASAASIAHAHMQGDKFLPYQNI